MTGGSYSCPFLGSAFGNYSTPESSEALESVALKFLTLKVFFHVSISASLGWVRFGAFQLLNHFPEGTLMRKMGEEGNAQISYR